MDDKPHQAAAESSAKPPSSRNLRRRFRMVAGAILGVALLVVLIRGIYVVVQVSTANGP